MFGRKEKPPKPPPILAHQTGVSAGAPYHPVFGFPFRAWAAPQPTTEHLVIHSPDGTGSSHLPIFDEWPEDQWPELPEKVWWRGDWIGRPAWLTPWLIPFWRPTNNWVEECSFVGSNDPSPTAKRRPRSVGGGLFEYWYWPRQFPYRFDAPSIAHFLESLDASVLYERSKLGLPIFGRAKNLVYPELNLEGVPFVEQAGEHGQTETSLIVDLRSVGFLLTYPIDVELVKSIIVGMRGSNVDNHAWPPQFWKLDLEEQAPEQQAHEEPDDGFTNLWEVE